MKATQSCLPFSFSSKNTNMYKAPQKELPPAGSLGPEPLNEPSEFLKDNLMVLVTILFCDTSASFDKSECSRVYELSNITPSIDRGLASACEMPYESGLRVWDLSELQDHCRYGLWAPPSGFMSENLLKSTVKDSMRRLCHFFKMCRQRPPSGHLIHLEDIIVIASIADYFGIFIYPQKNHKQKDFRRYLTQLLLPEVKLYGNDIKDNLLFSQISLHPANAVLLLKLAEVTCHRQLYREAGRHVVGIYEYVKANKEANGWFNKILDRRTIFAVHEEYGRVHTALRCAMMFNLNTMQFEEETVRQQKLEQYIQDPFFNNSLLEARLFIVRALAEIDDLKNLTEGTWPPKNMWTGIAPSVLEKRAKKTQRSRIKRNSAAYFTSQQLGQTDNFHPKVSNARYILRQLYANDDLWQNVLTPQGKSMESFREKLSSILPFCAVPTIQKRRLQDLKKNTEKEVFRSAMSLPDKTGFKDPIFALLREQVGHCLEKLVGDGRFREDGTPIVGEAESFAGCQKPSIDEGALSTKYDFFNFLQNFDNNGVPYLLCGNLSPPGYFTDTAWNDDICPLLNQSTPDLRKIMGTSEKIPVFKPGASRSVGELHLLLSGHKEYISAATGIPLDEIIGNNDRCGRNDNATSRKEDILDKTGNETNQTNSKESTAEPETSTSHVKNTDNQPIPISIRKRKTKVRMTIAEADRLLADCLALFDIWVSNDGINSLGGSNDQFPTKSTHRLHSTKTPKWLKEDSRLEPPRSKHHTGKENKPVADDGTSNKSIGNNDVHQIFSRKVTPIR